MNERLLDQLLDSPRLPSLPGVALQIVELVQDPEASTQQIASAIQCDPALTGKLLKTVNSPLYGQTQPVSSLSQAVVVLGTKGLKTLALSFSLAENLSFNGSHAMTGEQFWKRSLLAATIAKGLARLMRLPDQEQAFLAGLMQDLGVLTLAQVLGARYDSLLGQAGTSHRELAAIEQQALQLDHAHVGAALAQRWRLPEGLVEPVRYHEDPAAAAEQVDPALLPLVHCVAVANAAAEVFTSEDPAAAMPHYLSRANHLCQIQSEPARELLKNAHSEAEQMGKLFALPTGPMGDVQHILDRANEALTELSLQSQQETRALEAHNHELTRKLYTDALTGVANRRRLNHALIEQFQHACQHARPLSLLFLDVDHFKQFNDTHGHDFGDRVLNEMAQAITSLIPEPGLIARFGGEEFAILIPECDRGEAARLAERIRLHVAQLRLSTEEAPDVPVGLTVSIGVATHEAGTFHAPDQLFRAADQGLYIAKNAGRNCVRIYKPRCDAPTTTTPTASDTPAPDPAPAPTAAAP